MAAINVKTDPKKTIAHVGRVIFYATVITVLYSVFLQQIFMLLPYNVERIVSFFMVILAYYFITPWGTFLLYGAFIPGILNMILHLFIGRKLILLNNDARGAFVLLQIVNVCGWLYLLTLPHLKEQIGGLFNAQGLKVFIFCQILICSFFIIFFTHRKVKKHFI